MMGMMGLTDADLFAAIVRIEGVIDDVDGVPGVLIVANDGVDWNAAVGHSLPVEQRRSQTARTILFIAIQNQSIHIQF